MEHLFELMSHAFKPSGLDFRQRGILVAAAANPIAPWPGAASCQAPPIQPSRLEYSTAPTRD
jgi:hypothetical protein